MGNHARPVRKRVLHHSLSPLGKHTLPPFGFRSPTSTTGPVLHLPPAQCRGWQWQMPLRCLVSSVTSTTCSRRNPDALTPSMSALASGSSGRMAFSAGRSGSRRLNRGVGPPMGQPTPSGVPSPEGREEPTAADSIRSYGPHAGCRRTRADHGRRLRLPCKEDIVGSIPAPGSNQQGRHQTNVVAGALRSLFAEPMTPVR